MIVEELMIYTGTIMIIIIIGLTTLLVMVKSTDVEIVMPWRSLSCLFTHQRQRKFHGLSFLQS